jgi:polyisoprenoid-binding protein YceI
MRLTAGWKLPTLALLMLALAGCPLPRHAPPPAPAALPETPLPHLGRPFEVQAAQSSLLILVYRGGALASAGHNHVIASHDLSGSFYLPADLTRSSFELHLPLESLTVDEPQLRAAQPGEDFPPGVPDSAREGTRHNMLSEALLDAAQYPQIELRALSVSMARGTAAGDAEVRVQCEVRGQRQTVSVPVHYELRGNVLTVSADFALRQTQLGLTPFSALLGALQVQDEMRIRMRLSARAAR